MTEERFRLMLKHFRKHFRMRASEWSYTIMLTFWGIALFSQDQAMMNRYFGRLFVLWPQGLLASATVAVGVTGLAALTYNGLHRRTPIIRAAMSTLRVIFWSQIALGCLFSGEKSLAWAIYPVFAVFDFLNIKFAAVDDRQAAFDRASKVAIHEPV